MDSLGLFWANREGFGCFERPVNGMGRNKPGMSRRTGQRVTKSVLLFC